MRASRFHWLTCWFTATRFYRLDRNGMPDKVYAVCRYEACGRSWNRGAMSVFPCALAVLLLASCAVGAQTVATDVQVVEKPVPVVCRLDWPPAPRPHVALVQLTGDPKKDLVLIERAKEAELEERIAYEGKLEAAARACLK